MDILVNNLDILISSAAIIGMILTIAISAVRVDKAADDIIDIYNSKIDAIKLMSYDHDSESDKRFAEGWNACVDTFKLSRGEINE